eukprot:959299-Pyramimonas_sp.AAC.1
MPQNLEAPRPQQDGSKWPEKGSPRRPPRGPNPSKTLGTSVFLAFSPRPEDGSKMAQEGSKSAPKAPKTASRGPQQAPRRPQEGPTGAQEASNMSQEN